MTNESPPPEPEFDIRRQFNSLVRTTVVYGSLGQRVIVITEDKMELCLGKHLEKLEKRRGWIIPLGILLPILVCLLTSEFHWFIVDAAIWNAMFILVGGIALAWLIWSIYEALKNPTTIEDVLNELKEEVLSEPQESED